VLAPNAKLRPLVVPQGPVPAEQAADAEVASECDAETAQGHPDPSLPMRLMSKEMV
jgi:hypothetical protein